MDEATTDLANELQRRWRLVQESGLPADLEPIAFDFLLGIEDLTERLELNPGADVALIEVLRQAWRLVDEAALPIHLYPAAFRFAAREHFRAAGGQVRTRPPASSGTVYADSGPANLDVRPGPGREDVGYPGV